MTVVQYVLPAIRMVVAQELIEKHGLRQVDVAAKMDITPAAIAQYRKRKRGASFINPITNSREATIILSELARALAKSEVTIGTVMSKICDACRVIRSEGLICELHRESLPALRLCECKCPAC